MRRVRRRAVTEGGERRMGGHEELEGLWRVVGRKSVSWEIGIGKWEVGSNEL
jgi:hypothetical protein